MTLAQNNLKIVLIAERVKLESYISDRHGSLPQMWVNIYSIFRLNEVQIFRVLRNRKQRRRLSCTLYT